MNTKIKKLFNWRGDLLAVFAGLLMPLSFAPYDLPVLALVSMVLLMLCWHGVSKRRAFARGWLFGMGMFGLGMSWIHISMSQFGGVSLSLSIVLTTIFIAFYALFPAITGYMARTLASEGKHQIAREYLLIIPAAWLIFEWIRGFLFTGLPWLSLGYSQIDMPLSGYAPVLGVYGISFMLVFSAGIIVYWLLSGIPATKKALPALLMVWLIPVSLSQIQWSELINEKKQSLTISMIQGNVSQDLKWLLKQRQPTIDLYTKLSRENWGSDLIVWPETALPMTYLKALPFLKDIAQEARMNSSELLVGLPVYNPREKEYFNAMLSLGANEKFYEKKHLVPFGEFIPFKETLGDLIDYFDIPMSDFTRGRQETPVLGVAGTKAGISICYEDVFGEEIADALPEATFLINVSNDAWFGDSAAPHQHLQIARMRSLEMARYMARSTNTGVSAFITDKGEIQSQSPQFETHVLTDKVQLMTGMTPYVVFTNIPIVGLAGLMLGAALVLRRGK